MQGNMVLKDFNIAEEVGGVNNAVTKSFTIVISSNTLEIRLYWAGKETIGIPFKSVYGHLISAISVNSRELYLSLTTNGVFVSWITFFVLEVLFLKIKHENIILKYLIKKYVWLIIKLVGNILYIPRNN